MSQTRNKSVRVGKTKVVPISIKILADNGFNFEKSGGGVGWSPPPLFSDFILR